MGPTLRPSRPPGHRVAGPPHRRSLWGAAGRAPSGANGGSSRTRTSPLRSSNGFSSAPSCRRVGSPSAGTVDTWLIWKLTEGARHVTDVTNASRTMLVDLATGQWDDELLASSPSSDLFFPPSPARRASSRRRRSSARPSRLRALRGPAGRALRPGVLRARRGEGDLRHGDVRARQPRGAGLENREGRLENGLRRSLRERRPQFAAEGAVFVGGAALQWLRDGLGVIAKSGGSRSRLPVRSRLRRGSCSSRR